MGFVQLNNGEVVHTSIFDKNPIVEIINMGQVTEGNKTTLKKIYRYKDGRTQPVEMSYTVNVERK